MPNTINNSSSPTSTENPLLSALSGAAANLNSYSKEPQYVQDVTYGTTPFDTNLHQADEQDLESFRAAKQTATDVAFDGLARLGLTTVTKTMESLGYAAGFANWATTGFDINEISRMTDNAFAKLWNTAEEKVKGEFQIYKPKAVREGNIWDNLSSESFWADEGVDGGAYMFSAFAPGALFESIGLGGKAASLLAGGIDSAGDLGKVSTARTVIAKGLAEGLDPMAMAAYNSTTEAATEASQSKQQITDTLTKERQAGKNFYSDDEIKQMAAKGAANVFKSNLALLILPETLQANIFMGKLMSKATIIEKTLAKEAEDASISGTEKAANMAATSEGFPFTKGRFAENPKLFSTKDILGRMGKDALIEAASEGIVEEGGQNAIQDYYQKKAIANKKDSDKIVLADAQGLFNSYIDQALTTDGQKAMLLGAVMGIGGGLYGGYREGKHGNQAIEALHKALTDNPMAFLSLDVHQKNPDGTLVMDGDKPLLDQNKVAALALNNSKLINEEVFKNLAAADGQTHIADFIEKSQFAHWAYTLLSAEGGEELAKTQIGSITDEAINNYNKQTGQDIKPAEYREQKLKDLEELSKLSDKVKLFYGGRVEIGDLGINKKNSNEVSSAINFIENLKYKQAHNLFLQNYLKRALPNLDLELNTKLGGFSLNDYRKAIDSHDEAATNANDVRNKILFNNEVGKQHNETTKELLTQLEAAKTPEEEQAIADKLNAHKETISAHKEHTSQLEDEYKLALVDYTSKKETLEALTETKPNKLDLAEALKTENQIQRLKLEQKNAKDNFTALANKEAQIKLFNDALKKDRLTNEKSNEKLKATTLKEKTQKVVNNIKETISPKKTTTPEATTTEAPTEVLKKSHEELVDSLAKKLNNGLVIDNKEEADFLEAHRQEVMNRAEVLAQNKIDKEIVDLDNATNTDYNDGVTTPEREESSDKTNETNSTNLEVTPGLNKIIDGAPKVYQGSNILAYLSRDYKLVRIGDTNRFEYKDTSNELNENADPSLQLPGAVLPDSSEVTFEIDKDYSLGEDTYITLLAKGIGHVPIKVHIDGKFQGYLHDVNWLNEDNLYSSPEEIEKDKDNLLRIRQIIFDTLEAGGSISTKVTNVSNGQLIKDKDDANIKTSEALADPALKFGMVKNGLIVGPKSTVKVLDNTITMEGAVVALVPVNLDTNGEMLHQPIILRRTKLSPEAKTSVMKAIKAYLEYGTSDEANKIVNDIYEQTEHSINTIAGLRDYLSTFIPMYTKGEGLKHAITNVFNEVRDDFSSIRLFNISGNGIEFGAGSNSASYSFINKEEYQKGTTSKVQQHNLDRLEGYLDSMYQNIEQGKLNKTNVKVAHIDSEGNVTSNTFASYNDFIKANTETFYRSVELDNGKHIYTIQKVIAFNDNFEKPELQTIVNQTSQEVPTKEQEIAKIEKEFSEKNIGGTAFTFDGNVYDLQQNYNKAKAFLLEKTKDLAFVESKYGKSFEDWIPIEIKRLEDNKSHLITDMRNSEARDYATLKELQEKLKAISKVEEKYKSEESKNVTKEAPISNTPRRNEVVKWADKAQQALDNIPNVEYQDRVDTKITVDLANALRIIFKDEDRIPEFKGYSKEAINYISNNPKIYLAAMMNNPSQVKAKLQETLNKSKEGKLKYADRDDLKDSQEALNNVKTKLEDGEVGIFQSPSGKFGVIIELGKTAFYNKYKWFDTLEEAQQEIKYKPLENISEPVKPSEELSQEDLNNLLGGISERDETGLFGSIDQSYSIDSDEIIKEQKEKYFYISDSYKDILVPGMYLRDMSSTVRVFAALINNQFNYQAAKTGKQELKVSEVFNNIKAKLESNKTKFETTLRVGKKATKDGIVDLTEQEKVAYTRLLSNTELVLNNFEKLKDITISQVEKLSEVKIKVNKATVSTEQDAIMAEGLADDIAEEALNEEVEDNKETAQEKIHDNDASFKVDPIKTTGGVLKRIFNSVLDLDEKGNKTYNFIGLENVVAPNKVFNTILELMSDTPSSYDEKIQILQDNVKTYPWLKSVIDSLNNSPQRVKNTFGSISYTSITMKKVMFGTREKTGPDGEVIPGAQPINILSIFDANANSRSQIILNNWRNNLTSTNLLKVSEAGELEFNHDEINSLLEEYKTITSGKEVNPEDIKKWLNKIGIDLSAKTIDKLKASGFAGVKDFNSLFKIANSPFVVLNDKLKSALKETNNPDNFDLYGDGAITKLAKTEETVTDRVLGTSFRDGEDSLSSFRVNSYLDIRFNELLQDKALLKSLLGGENQGSNFFTQDSTWLKELVELDDDGKVIFDSNGDVILKENTAFTNNFDIDWVALNTLIEKGETDNTTAIKEAGDSEHEKIKLAMLMNSHTVIGKGDNLQRVMNFFYPSTGKTSIPIITATGIDIKYAPDGSIANSVIDKLYNSLFLPEFKRIFDYQKNNRKSVIKGYDEGAQMFLMLPSLNNIKDMFVGGKINPILDTDEPESRALKAAVKQEIRNYVRALTEEKLALWESIGMKENNNRFLHSNYSTFLEQKGKTNKEQKLVAAAEDMVINYLIANANLHQLFIGDPAQFYKVDKEKLATLKTTEEKNIQKAKDTFDNISKRLAMDIAPMMRGNNSESGTYTQLFLADKISESSITPYLKRLFENNPEALKPYLEIEGTDAQEMTTIAEHLYVMYSLGKLDSEEYKEYLSIANSHSTEYTQKQLAKILNSIPTNPQKPLYAGHQNEFTSNAEIRTYIKSSSFPLIPQLTKGLELDKLRIMMEKHNIDRAAYATAVKVGGLKEPLNIFKWKNIATGETISNDEYKNLTKDEKESFYKSDEIYENLDTAIYKRILNRKNFGIQQEVPLHDHSSTINGASQADTLLFSGILDVKDFISPYTGKKVTGKELKDLFAEEYGKLFKHQFLKLNEEIYKEDGTLDLEKIADIIKRENVKTLSINDMKSLELKENQFGEKEFVVNFAFAPSDMKYQALLNSIIDNRIRKREFSGFSSPLGSEEGFKGVFSLDQLSSEQKYGITFIKGYDASTTLNSSQEVNGEMKPTEVLAPWRFSVDGKMLKMSDFVDKKTNTIDPNKLPDELLEIFGFRIPTQGHNSMSHIKIVGFLPEAMGDLLIAPRDFTKQMGSDFDIDKLYNYMYNFSMKDGKLTKYQGEDESKAIQNRLLDIRLAILSNPNEQVQRKIKEPLGFGKLKEWGDKLSEGKNFNPYFTGLSDDYQRVKYIQLLDGKTGVGSFSLDSTFLSMLEGQQEFTLIGEDGPLVVRFGDSVNNSVWETKTNTDRLKSDVISAFQSAAVDDLKEQILAKTNINSFTFDSIRALALMGFDEDIIIPFINQPIIKDYIRALKGLQDNTRNTQYGKKTDLAKEEIIKKYSSANYKPEMVELANLSSSEMTDIITGKNTSDFNNIQRAMLDKFIAISDTGKGLKIIQSAINTFSSGLGKNFFETLIKEEQVLALYSNSTLSNAYKLVGDYIPVGKLDVTEKNMMLNQGYVLSNNEQVLIKPTTINGFASVYALFVNNKTWNNFYPYDSLTISNIIQKIEENSKSAEGESVTSKAEKRNKLFKEFKKFMFSSQALGIIKTNINDERERLFFDRNDNKSLASVIEEVKRKGLVNNAIIRDLSLAKGIGDIPSTIKFSASRSEGFDELEYHQSFIDMLTNPVVLGDYYGNPNYTSANLVEDMITHQYAQGGIQEANQFLKYIPIAYLEKSGMFDKLNQSNLFNNSEKFENFIQQYFQHNPSKIAVKLSNKELNKIDYAKVTDKKQLNVFSFNSKGLEQFTTVSNGKIKITLPEFVTLSSNRPSGYNIYKLVTTSNGDHFYTQIDNLGSVAKYGLSEYNQLDGNPKSLITANQVKHTTTETAPIRTAIAEQGLEKVESIFDSYSFEETNTPSETKKVLTKVLSKIQNESTNPYHKELAAYLLSTLDNNQNLQLRVKDNENYIGAYDSQTNILNLNKSKIENNNSFETTFFEEYLHAITVPLIDEFRKARKGEANTLTKTQLDKLNSLYLLFGKLDSNHLSELTDGVLSQDKAKEIIKEMRALNDSGKLAEKWKTLTSEERDIYRKLYPLVNFKEFVAHIMKNPKLQERLNNIKDSSGVSILDRIKGLLKDLIGTLGKSLGIEIKENSVLAKAIDDVLDLTKPITQEVNQEQVISELEKNPEETVITEFPKVGYPERTRENAKADATIAIAVDFNTPGEKLTKNSVNQQGKKYIPIDANKLEVTNERVNKIVDELNLVNAKTLNIAGNGIYTMKGKYTQEQLNDFVIELLRKVINSPRLNNKIESIRSGGQTGFDEAGIIAAQRLGIKAIVLAPKGYIFRDINGKDISDEKLFKERFGIKPKDSGQLDLFDIASTDDKIINPFGIIKDDLGSNISNSIDEESLGTTAVNYMRSLDKTNRDQLRDMINKGLIKFNC